jgi:hypothetical protein
MIRNQSRIIEKFIAISGKIQPAKASTILIKNEKNINEKKVILGIYSKT